MNNEKLDVGYNEEERIMKLDNKKEGRKKGECVKDINVHDKKRQMRNTK